MRSPYADVLRVLVEHEDGLTLTEIVNARIPSYGDPSHPIGFSWLSRVVLRLVNEGIVVKREGKFRVTGKIWDIYSRRLIVARVRGNDSRALNPPSFERSEFTGSTVRGVPELRSVRVVWGDFSKSVGLGELLDGHLTAIEGILKDESFRTAIIGLEDEMNRILGDQRIKMREKVYAIAEAARLLEAELAQSNVPDSKLEELKLETFTRKLLTNSGIELAGDKFLKLLIRRKPRKYMKGGEWKLRRQPRSEIIKRLASKLDPLKVPPLVAVQVPVKY
jgi:hypothetical protein